MDKRDTKGFIFSHKLALAGPYIIGFLFIVLLVFFRSELDNKVLGISGYFYFGGLEIGSLFFYFLSKKQFKNDIERAQNDLDQME